MISVVIKNYKDNKNGSGPPHSSDSTCCTEPRLPSQPTTHPSPPPPLCVNTSREGLESGAFRWRLFRARFSPCSQWNFQPGHWPRTLDARLHPPQPLRTQLLS